LIARASNTGNSEVIINYKKKSVAFIPAGYQMTENTSYFTHNFVQYLSFFLVIVLEILLAKNYFNSYSGILAYATAAIIFFLMFLAFFYIFGWLSVFIHKKSAYLKLNYPKTNSIFMQLLPFRKIIFNKPSSLYGLRHAAIGRKLIIFNVSCLMFEYEYEGYNELLKIETKSSQINGMSGIAVKFHAIFTFKDIIKEGMVKWRG